MGPQATSAQSRATSARARARARVAAPSARRVGTALDDALAHEARQALKVSRAAVTGAYEVRVAPLATCRRSRRGESARKPSPEATSRHGPGSVRHAASLEPAPTRDAGEREETRDYGNLGASTMMPKPQEVRSYCGHGRSVQQRTRNTTTSSNTFESLPRAAAPLCNQTTVLLRRRAAAPPSRRAAEHSEGEVMFVLKPSRERAPSVSL